MGQVVYPCFGFRDTIGVKTGLCKILRDIDPTFCYVLPEDRDRVTAQMDGDHTWVSKTDINVDRLTSYNSNQGVWVPEGREEYYYNSHQHHAGKAVQFISAPDQLPHIEPSSKTQGIVQPFYRPHLGAGCMRRKWELRVFATVVSVNPPRFYYNVDWEVIVARSVYNGTVAGSDMCVHDTHSALLASCNTEGGGCHVDLKGWPEDGAFVKGTHGWDGRHMAYQTFARLAKMPDSATATLRRRVHRLLSRIFHHPDVLKGLRRNPITAGIDASRATCFNVLRADFGVTEALRPVLFEINLAPETKVEDRKELGSRLQLFRDLFKMLELHRPGRRVLRAERAAWEQQNLGNWTPILPLDSSDESPPPSPVRQQCGSAGPWELRRDPDQVFLVVPLDSPNARTVQVRQHDALRCHRSERNPSETRFST